MFVDLRQDHIRPGQQSHRAESMEEEIIRRA